MASKEIELPQVQKLLAKGKKQGVLSAEEIVDVLHEVELSTDQMDNIYSTLLDQGIEIVDAPASVASDPEPEPPAIIEDKDGEIELAPARPRRQLDLSVKKSE